MPIKHYVKTDWKKVTAGIVFAVILGAYIHRVNADTGIAISIRPNLSVSGSEAKRMEENCSKAERGSLSCDLTDWNEIGPKIKEGLKWHEATPKVTKKVPTTAYNSFPNQTDSTPCIAADGSDICKRHEKGEVIYATNDLPLGTKIAVNGVIGTVADRMNRRYTGTGRIDRYMGYDLKGARAYGLRMATVEILK